MPYIIIIIIVIFPYVNTLYCDKLIRLAETSCLYICVYMNIITSTFMPSVPRSAVRCKEGWENRVVSDELVMLSVTTCNTHARAR